MKKLERTDFAEEHELERIFFGGHALISQRNTSWNAFFSMVYLSKSDERTDFLK